MEKNKISKFKDFSKELKDYINGELKLAPITNILMNDYSKNWYAEIGKYFVEQYGIENLKNHQFLLDKLKRSKKDKELSYQMLGIYFITSYLDEASLKEMFGNPICHSEFGEGFDRKRKYEFCSYIVDINKHKIHIGFDHRGTIIEVEDSLEPIVVFEIIKELVDKFTS